MKRRLVAIAMGLSLCVGFAAQADAHTAKVSPRFMHGYFGDHAVVTGTVTGVSADSFTANAYVVTPGAGGSSSTPTETSVTITPGTGTKLVVDGQSGAAVDTIVQGDDFYAVYKGVSSSAGITTITGGTPSAVFAYAAPTPKFVVEGTVTAAPTSGDPDQFTATAEIVQPGSHGSHGFGRFRHSRHGDGYRYSAKVDGFRIGSVGGDYGYSGRVFSSHHRGRGTYTGAGTTTTPTTGVVITVDDNTKFDVDGNRSATASDLADGQKFVAVFDGSPSTASLSSLPPAVAVYARTVKVPYGFVGTVASTDTTDTPNTITVDVTKSWPSGLFSGDDVFTIGTDTRVMTMSGKALTDVNVGDTVAGGVFAPAGQTAAQIEADPLKFLVDFPGTSSSSSSSSIHKAEAKLTTRAKKLLGIKSRREVSKRNRRGH